MAIQKINLGTEPLGEGGDTYRSANTKINENFSNTEHAASRLVDTTIHTQDTLYTVRNTDAQINNAKVVLQYQQGGIGGTGIGYLKDVRSLGTYEDREPDARLMYISGLSAEIDNGVNLNIDTQQGSVKAGSGFVLNLGGYYNMGGAGYMGRVVFSGGRMYVQAVTYRESYKATYGTKWTQWNEFYSTGNTTKDTATGFLKASSPVLHVYNDSITKIHEAEQLDITVDKKGVGHYEIHGTTGLRKDDGWFMSPPRDIHGNVLCMVDLEEKDGVIILKTYKKLFDFETVSIVHDYDNPMDIPDGVCVEFRFNDLPEEELEYPDPVEESK